MKTIHVLCSIQVSDDEYSGLLNPGSKLSMLNIVYQAVANGGSKITFSDPMILIPLPPK